MAIWVLKDGQREGPYEEQDVRELIYEGTYTDMDPAIQDGQLDWTTIGQLLGRGKAAEEPGDATETVLPPPVLPAEETAAPEPAPVPVENALVTEPLPAAVQGPIQVRVVDFQMPISSMIVFLFKWMIASIIVFGLLGFLAALFWGAFVVALLHH